MLLLKRFNTCSEATELVKTRLRCERDSVLTKKHHPSCLFLYKIKFSKELESYIHPITYFYCYKKVSLLSKLFKMDVKNMEINLEKNSQDDQWYRMSVQQARRNKGGQ